MRIPLSGLLVLGALVASGCDAPGPTSRNFSYLRLTTTSKSDAFQAAGKAMAERFDIADADPLRGSITSVPMELESSKSGTRIGDAVGVPRRLRQLAETRVSGSDNAAEIWCKVLVQQYEADEHTIFQQEGTMTDVPRDTPADRGGATTPEQNVIWRTVRRDKVAERGILRSVQEMLAPPAADRAPPGM